MVIPLHDVLQCNLSQKRVHTSIINEASLLFVVLSRISVDDLCLEFGCCYLFVYPSVGMCVLASYCYCLQVHYTCYFSPMDEYL